MYASDSYQAVAAERGGPGRLPALTETFRQATRIETAFWQMGLHAVSRG